jgi:hypothetical protein
LLTSETPAPNLGVVFFKKQSDVDVKVPVREPLNVIVSVETAPSERVEVAMKLKSAAVVTVQGAAAEVVIPHCDAAEATT